MSMRMEEIAQCLEAVRTKIIENFDLPKKKSDDLAFMLKRCIEEIGSVDKDLQEFIDEMELHNKALKVLTERSADKIKELAALIPPDGWQWVPVNIAAHSTMKLAATNRAVCQKDWDSMLLAASHCEMNPVIETEKSPTIEVSREWS